MLLLAENLLPDSRFAGKSTLENLRGLKLAHMGMRRPYLDM